jgi:hypothetical protein
MKRIPRALYIIGCSIAMILACNNKKSEQPVSGKEIKLKEENITYTGDNATMNGFVVYDENSTKKRPAILVAPEW